MSDPLDPAYVQQMVFHSISWRLTFCLPFGVFVVGRALRATGGAKLEKECNMVSSQTSMSVTEG